MIQDEGAAEGAPPPAKRKRLTNKANPDKAKSSSKAQKNALSHAELERFLAENFDDDKENQLSPSTDTENSESSDSEVSKDEMTDNRKSDKPSDPNNDNSQESGESSESSSEEEEREEETMMKVAKDSASEKALLFPVDGPTTIFWATVKFTATFRESCHIGYSCPENLASARWGRARAPSPPATPRPPGAARAHPIQSAGAAGRVGRGSFRQCGIDWIGICIIPPGARGRNLEAFAGFRRLGVYMLQRQP